MLNTQNMSSFLNQIKKHFGWYLIGLFVVCFIGWLAYYQMANYDVFTANLVSQKYNQALDTLPRLDTYFDSNVKVGEKYDFDFLRLLCTGDCIKDLSQVKVKLVLPLSDDFKGLKLDDTGVLRGLSLGHPGVYALPVQLWKDDTLLLTKTVRFTVVR